MEHIINKRQKQTVLVQMSAGVGRDGRCESVEIFSDFSVFSLKWEIRLSAEHKAV